MALIKCAGCGRPVSSRATSCPKCGYRHEIAEETASSQETTYVGGDCSSARPAATETIVSGPVLPAEKAAHDLTPWHYIAASERKGPVTLAEIRELAAKGQLPPDVPIWKSGLEDWIPLSQYHEESITAATDSLQDELHVSPAKLPALPLVWALALAPLWGSVVQIIITELWVGATHIKLAYYAQMWWIMLGLNFCVSYLDFSTFKKSGADNGKMENWLYLAIPVYLYRRDKMVEANLTRVIVWSSSMAASLAIFRFLNNIYLKM